MHDKRQKKKFGNKQVFKCNFMLICEKWDFKSGFFCEAAKKN